MSKNMRRVNKIDIPDLKHLNFQTKTKMNLNGNDINFNPAKYAYLFK